MISQNQNGEYALFDQGKLIGFAAVKLINGVRVIESMYDKIIALQNAAENDQVNLTLSSGLRSWDEQMNLRIRNVIDKSKQHDLDFLVNAPSSAFSPTTAKPGWSNHQDGKAYDFKINGFPAIYKWLVRNAINFHFVRTVSSERWHWEYLPGKNQFTFVPQENPTWDGLV
ncbi:M15 family metallopeptidase [Ohtaekwangia sp.]|uniref:M15 family metallopeptidase n=1 Tax=Ohtaekwangia sp. TaxID=2066019 RepID=UPI002F92D833